MTRIPMHDPRCMKASNSVTVTVTRLVQCRRKRLLILTIHHYQKFLNWFPGKPTERTQSEVHFRRQNSNSSYVRAAGHLGL